LLVRQIKKEGQMAGGSQKAAGLREIFEMIRERADYALQWLAAFERVKSLR
jgi:hypothetical protein